MKVMKITRSIILYPIGNYTNMQHSKCIGTITCTSNDNGFGAGGGVTTGLLMCTSQYRLIPGFARF